MLLSEFYTRRKTDITVLDERLRAVVGQILSHRPDRVVDLACGSGTLLRALREALPAAELIGFDIAPAAIASLEADGFRCSVADLARELPLEANRVDCAIFGEIIEHLVDPDFALLEIARVLVEDGLLVLTTPNLASWFNRVALLFGIQPIFTETSLHANLGRRSEMLGQWGPVQGHLKIFVLAALREMLAANGFRIVAVAGAPFFPPNALTPLDRVFARFPNLASNFIVVARNGKATRTRYPSRR